MVNKMVIDFSLWRAYNLTQEVRKFWVGQRQVAMGTTWKRASPSEAGAKVGWEGFLEEYELAR